MTNNTYKGVQAWMQALLNASQSDTLGNWWNARTLECVLLGTEMSVADKLEVYKDGLEFTKALHAAAKGGLLTQSDVDYNVNKLLMIRWKFQNDFFHLEEIVEQQELTSSDEEAIITFSSEMQSAELIKDVEVDLEAPLKEEAVEPLVVTPPKKALGGRPRKQAK